jgi:hypothetical protein
MSLTRPSKEWEEILSDFSIQLFLTEFLRPSSYQKSTETIDIKRSQASNLHFRLLNFVQNGPIRL